MKEPGLVPCMLSTCTQELPFKKTKEKKGTLPASLVTGGYENQREGSGAGSAVPCEALGLLPVSVEAQQVPVTSPRGDPQLSVWAPDPVLVQSSCSQPFILRVMLSQAAPERVGTVY